MHPARAALRIDQGPGVGTCLLVPESRSGSSAGPAALTTDHGLQNKTYPAPHTAAHLSSGRDHSPTHTTWFRSKSHQSPQSWLVGLSQPTPSSPNQLGCSPYPSWPFWLQHCPRWPQQNSPPRPCLPPGSGDSSLDIFRVPGIPSEPPTPGELPAAEWGRPCVLPLPSILVLLPGRAGAALSLVALWRAHRVWGKASTTCVGIQGFGMLP